MIIVTLRNIEGLELPLDNSSMIMERGTSKKVLKELEKKYNLKSHHLCFKSPHFGYNIYANAAYYYIPEEDKQKWVTNYEVYVRSSFIYKYWIVFYKVSKYLDL